VSHDDDASPLILSVTPVGVGDRRAPVPAGVAVVLGAANGDLVEAGHGASLLAALRYRYRYEVSTGLRTLSWQETLRSAVYYQDFRAELTAWWHVSQPVEVVRDNVVTAAGAWNLIRLTVRDLLAHHLRTFGPERAGEAENYVRDKLFDRPRLIPGGITVDRLLLRLDAGEPRPDPGAKARRMHQAATRWIEEAQERRVRWERMMLAADQEHVEAGADSVHDRILEMLHGEPAGLGPTLERPAPPSQLLERPQPATPAADHEEDPAADGTPPPAWPAEQTGYVPVSRPETSQRPSAYGSPDPNSLSDVGSPAADITPHYPHALSEAPQPRRLVVELAERAAPGRSVPLQVQITAGDDGPGRPLRLFDIPAAGVRLLVTVHAPGLDALGDLEQEVTVEPGRDSDVLVFPMRTRLPGLQDVTVRVFRGGAFLGELRTQLSVEDGAPTRDRAPSTAPLAATAHDPGEVTLQVLRGADGGNFFQLLSETFYPPVEISRMQAGDPRRATEQIYAELKHMAATSTKADPAEARRRLRNHGVQLWASAVPDAVQRQFWEQAGRMSSFTVLGEHDVVPWELLYPLDGHNEGDGFLAEWLPIVRRVYGQERVQHLPLRRAAFVVPPGSPPEADAEVRALRERLGPGVADAGTFTRRAALSDLIDSGHAGLLHFACHNAFTGSGSCVTMADASFDPIDLAYAANRGVLRATHPLVFFNACRSAGEIPWFDRSLGWAPQFLRAGAGAFVGTLWAVRSDSALTFADAFYRHLLSGGLSLGRASLEARRAVRDVDADPTWLAYAVYGSPAARAAVTA
jgi:CHAT domain